MPDAVHRLLSPTAARRLLEASAFCVAVVIVVSSAVIAKRAAVGPALVALDTQHVAPATADPVDMIAASPELPVVEIERSEPVAEQDATIRWFDGRAVRPARTIWMTVTAYSPDHRSCGKWADGRTATNTSVWTNGMHLVAADTRLLPYGSLLTVPGYADDEIVPVLDCGGAIKGARLDVLYPTHKRARQWGVQRLKVTVWEYVDEATGA